MKVAAFEYHRPRTVEEALALMAEHGEESRPLAGGQSLVPMMAFRLASPQVLIDLNLLDDLARIESGGGQLTVGAMVRERVAERSADVTKSVPLLAGALPLIGHEAIRTRGTIGGSLAHCDPAGELPAVAVAAGAWMTARSRDRGERRMAAGDFFITSFTTALADDEILVSVTFPAAREGTGTAFEEMARRHGDFAIVGAATQLHLSGGTIDEARVVLTGVADTPFRATAAEAVLTGAAPGPSVFAEAAHAAQGDLDPPSDLHGTAAYRRHVAGVLIQRSLANAAAGTGAQ